MAEKLKPCPFCGAGNGPDIGAVFACEQFYDSTRGWIQRIKCKVCGATGPEAKSIPDESDAPSGSAWNRRAKEKAE